MAMNLSQSWENLIQETCRLQNYKLHEREWLWWFFLEISHHLDKCLCTSMIFQGLLVITLSTVKCALFARRLNFRNNVQTASSLCCQIRSTSLCLQVSRKPRFKEISFIFPEWYLIGIQGENYLSPGKFFWKDSTAVLIPSVVKTREEETFQICCHIHYEIGLYPYGSLEWK